MTSPPPDNDEPGPRADTSAGDTDEGKGASNGFEETIVSTSITGVTAAPNPDALTIDDAPDSVESNDDTWFPTCREYDEFARLVALGGMDRYILGPIVGRGAVGDIHKVWDVQLQREIAFKVLHRKKMADPIAMRRFLHEAQVTSRLEHPGVLGTHEIGILPDKRPFFSLNLVRGETLHTVLSRRENPSEDFGKIISIFERVCDTIAYAHAAGVIHRDLKPMNILVGDYGLVLVIDWGLSKVMSTPDTFIYSDATPPAEMPDLQYITLDATGLADTQTGTIIGTPAYLAPEQAQGKTERVDQRVDVFALGSILCEILTGQPAYVDTDRGRLLVKAMSCDLADAFERLDACRGPTDLIALAKACLSRRRSGRPGSGVYVAEAINDFLNSERRRAERELVRFFDLSLDLFCIAGMNGHFERVNDNFSKTLGYSPDELITQPFLSFVHPEDLDRTRSIVELLERGEPCIQFVNRYRHARGHYLRLEWNARLVADEKRIYAVGRDITARSNNEARRSAILDSSLDAIITFDAEGTILDFNHAAESMFGHDSENVVNTWVFRLLGSKAREACPIGGFQNLLDSSDHGFLGKLVELTGRNAMGEEFPIEIVVTLVPQAGPPVFTALVRDIRDRKQADAALAQAEAAARGLAALLETSDEAILIQDCSGTIRSWNRGAETLLGYSADEMIGAPISLLIPPDRPDTESGIVPDPALDGRLDTTQTQRLHKDGRAIDVSVVRSTLNSTNGHSLHVFRMKPA